MIVIPKCPNCGSNTAPDLMGVKVLETMVQTIYEEHYQCRCGCSYVAIVPREITEDTITHKVIRDGCFEKWE